MSALLALLHRAVSLQQGRHVGKLHIHCQTSSNSSCNPLLKECILKVKWTKGKFQSASFSEFKSSGKQAGLGPPVHLWPVSHGWSEMRWKALGGATKLIDHRIGEKDEGGIPSASGQIGQHSPSGMMGSAQSEVSSQITSSHMTVPLSQTQIWQGSGFHTSLSLYNCPSNVQLPNVPGRRRQRWVWWH